MPSSSHIKIRCLCSVDQLGLFLWSSSFNVETRGKFGDRPIHFCWLLLYYICSFFKRSCLYQPYAPSLGLTYVSFLPTAAAASKRSVWATVPPWESWASAWTSLNPHWASIRARGRWLILVPCYRENPERKTKQAIKNFSIFLKKKKKKIFSILLSIFVSLSLSLSFCRFGSCAQSRTGWCIFLFACCSSSHQRCIAFNIMLSLVFHTDHFNKRTLRTAVWITSINVHYAPPYECPVLLRAPPTSRHAMKRRSPTGLVWACLWRA